ncbi:MAG: C69 family dipeptidase [Muribaculaceae bacterium]|nr:C69 family dipeptidase [Muribaculaceae bacterium]
MPDNAVLAHANQSRIRCVDLSDTTNVMISKNCISFARKRGYLKGNDSEFSFCDAYNPLSFGGRRLSDSRVWAIYRRLTNGMDRYLPYVEGKKPMSQVEPLPMWIVPDKKLTVNDVIECLRDHFEGTALAMDNDPGAGLYDSSFRPQPLRYDDGGTTMFNERPVATTHTAFTWVCQLRSFMPREVGGVIWWGNDDSGMVAYTPVYCCANRYGSRQRNWQIAPLLTAIAKNYKAKSEHTTTQLRITVAVISILALLLLGALLFLHRRHKQLTAARNVLHQTNSQLELLNNELKTANNQLSEKNEQFSVLNSQLSESNRVKEEYIGRFMSLCSQYIDKLDAYRKMVNKKMKNKEFDELFRISKSTELKETELEELYENFDSVFLHLFPSFVDDFNALLQPEAQVHPKQENRLTTEMRIFALIRLGIEDSSKIAEFLHYSVNTIYNYRARIKNGAIASREHFEQDVKKLGQIQYSFLLFYRKIRKPKKNESANILLAFFCAFVACRYLIWNDFD